LVPPQGGNSISISLAPPSRGETLPLLDQAITRGKIGVKIKAAGLGDATGCDACLITALKISMMSFYANNNLRFLMFADGGQVGIGSIHHRKDYH
jgi:hypothetical protein